MLVARISAMSIAPYTKYCREMHGQDHGLCVYCFPQGFPAAQIGREVQRLVSEGRRIPVELPQFAAYVEAHAPRKIA